MSTNMRSLIDAEAELDDEDDESFDEDAPKPSRREKIDRVDDSSEEDDDDDACKSGTAAGDAAAGS